MANALQITLEELGNRVRNVETDDEPWVESLVDQAVRLLLSQRRFLATHIANQRVDRESVMDVVGRMVSRVTSNPEGFKSESEGEYRYEQNALVASGNLWVPDEDWALVTPAPSPAFGTARVTATPGWRGW